MQYADIGTGDHLDKADAILSISNKGVGDLKSSKAVIKKYADTNLSQRNDRAISDGATDDISASRHYRAPPPKEKISTSLLPKTDRSLWSFYLGSMSRTVFVLWVLANAVEAVLERSIGKFYGNFAVRHIQELKILCRLICTYLD